MSNPIVILETTLGEITLSLFPEKAPISVENFLMYVRSGFYEQTIFHRVIPDFMVQGGGLLWNLKEKTHGTPIKNEAKNGLKNRRGTVALARTSDVNSACVQFFINLVDNEDLDHRGDGADEYGYAVFGEVTDGMDVIDKIAAVPTHAEKGHEAVPDKAISIKAAVEM